MPIVLVTEQEYSRSLIRLKEFFQCTLQIRLSSPLTEKKWYGQARHRVLNDVYVGFLIFQTFYISALDWCIDFDCCLGFSYFPNLLFQHSLLMIHHFPSWLPQSFGMNSQMCLQLYHHHVYVIKIKIFKWENRKKTITNLMNF